MTKKPLLSDLIKEVFSFRQLVGEKLLPFRAMAIPILLTGASTNVSRYGLDTSYERYIITVRQNVNYFRLAYGENTRPDYLDVFFFHAETEMIIVSRRPS